MNNEYNDFLICTPENMKKIARAYKEQLQNANKQPPQLQDMPEFNSALNYLQKCYQNIYSLNTCCSKNFYIKKHSQIQDVLNKLGTIFLPQKNIVRLENYCWAINNSIESLCFCARECLNINCNKDNKEINKMLKTIIDCINDISNLVGRCKYMER